MASAKLYIVAMTKEEAEAFAKKRKKDFVFVTKGNDVKEDATKDNDKVFLIGDLSGHEVLPDIWEKATKKGYTLESHTLEEI